MEVLPRPARPYRHAYEQTLTMKMFLADNKGQVSLTFEQALDVMRRVDNLTRGIPKIFYLVGWQYDGHDTGYPAWDVVNPKLKREQDATALDSLRWLMAQARQYHTTVSFHVNMLDASANSPLWQTYLDADVIARNADGSLRTYVWGYPISYTLEWRAGLTQRRIDSLLDMVDMRRIGTVHVDAFHQYIPGYGTEPISPYHGITTDEEIETQKKIIRYWRDRGVDVTSEFTYSYRKDPLLGLQPMAWHFRNVDQMVIPPALHVGGKGGDPRFGTSMQGESIIRKDPVALPGFLDEFATTTLLWQHLNRLGRVSDTNGAVTFSDGTVSANIDGRLLVRRGDLVLRDGNDLFVPANWARHKEGRGVLRRRLRVPHVGAPTRVAASPAGRRVPDQPGRAGVDRAATRRRVRDAQPARRNRRQHRPRRNPSRLTRRSPSACTEECAAPCSPCSAPYRSWSPDPRRPHRPLWINRRSRRPRRWGGTAGTSSAATSTRS
jgi:hypothetical protein